MTIISEYLSHGAQSREAAIEGLLFTVLVREWLFQGCLYLFDVDFQALVSLEPVSPSDDQ